MGMTISYRSVIIKGGRRHFPTWSGLHIVSMFQRQVSNRNSLGKAHGKSVDSALIMYQVIRRDLCFTAPLNCPPCLRGTAWRFGMEFLRDSVFEIGLVADAKQTHCKSTP